LSRLGGASFAGSRNYDLPMAEGDTIHVWLIDDSEDHHQVARATVQLLPDMDFTGFMSGAAAVAEYERRAQDNSGDCPDIVLMDFYLGGERGDRVTRQLRQREANARRLVIVGYSSVRSGSDAIMASGGDIIVRKHIDGVGINPSLLAYLRSFGSARS
jgi:CheY-like chemotaxis protein